MPYSNTYSTSEWLGTWDMNTNGDPGLLTIASVIPTGADYLVNATLLEGGIWKPVTGTLESSRPLIAHLNVTSGGSTQMRTLHYHFWEDKLASGSVTAPGLVRTGVHAVKR